MRKSGKFTGKLRFLDKQADVQITDAKSSAGRTIGHVISGENSGPNLLIAGSGAHVRSAYQRLLLLPFAREWRGKIVLLYLDELDTIEAQEAVKRMAELVRPLAGSLFHNLQSQSSGEGNSKNSDFLVRILQFLKNHGAGAFGDNRPTPGVCDCVP